MKTRFSRVGSSIELNELLAKTEIFGQTQLLDFAQGLFEFFALGIIFGKDQYLLMTAIGQLGRQNQEVGTNRIQGGGEIFFGQTKSLEPVNNIGREQKQLEEGDVGTPGMGRDFGQGIIVKELAIVFLDGGSGIVKQIDAPGRDFEIGDEDMIDDTNVVLSFWDCIQSERLVVGRKS